MFAIRGEVKCQRLSASFCGECSQTAWHLHLSKDCQSLLLDRLQDPGILLGLRDILGCGDLWCRTEQQRCEQHQGGSEIGDNEEAHWSSFKSCRLTCSP